MRSRSSAARCCRITPSFRPMARRISSDTRTVGGFMSLRSLRRRANIANEGHSGERVCEGIGCYTRHVDTLQAGSKSFAPLDRTTQQAYSDHLLHDLAVLADGETQGNAS